MFFFCSFEEDIQTKKHEDILLINFCREGENIVPPTEKSDSEPHRIRLLSWNIDGLDNNNVKTRAKAVVNTINS